MKIICCLFVLLVSIVNSELKAYQYAHCSFGKYGSAKFISQEGIEKVELSISISGMEISDGDHALSILTYGYNPINNTDLGSITSSTLPVGPIGCTDPKREGDIGNLEFKNGISTGTISTLEGYYLFDDTQASILGRSLVIYSGSYICTNPSTSIFGSIIASCIISVGNPEYAQTKQPINITSPNPNTASGFSSTDKVLYDAMANIKSTNLSQGITGFVYFKPDISNATIEVTAIIKGFTINTTHGIHIHSYGDLSTQDGLSIGGHWSSLDQVHSLPGGVSDGNKHFGDIGNICVYGSDGTAYYKYSTSYFNFGQLLGKSIAIHLNRDDGKTVGGVRIAVGVIALVKKDTINSIPDKVPTDLVYDILCVPPETPSPTNTQTNPPFTPIVTKENEETPEKESSSTIIYPFINLIILSIFLNILYIN